MTILCGRADDAASSSGMTSGSSAGTTKDPRTRVKVGDVQTFRSLLDRLRALPAARADALLAAVLLAEGLFEVVRLRDARRLAARAGRPACSSAVQAAALAVRRRWPVVPLLVLFGLEPVMQAVGKDVTDHMAGPFFWLLLAGYTWGMHTEGVRLWAGAVVRLRDGRARRAAVDAYADGFTSYLSTVCLIALAPILFGQVLRNRARLNRALHSRAERAERERAAAADAAALEERTRIAGDLHDVVAHALSAMTVQAGAARRMAERDPERAEASFAVVEHTGREALTELRRLLGVLRREDEELALAPQPSLAHVRSLIQRAGAAGLLRRAADRGRARAAAGRRRPDRLPARAGGAAARARGRARGARERARDLRAPARCGSRSSTTAGPRTAGCSACASASPSTAASSRRPRAEGGGWRVAARLPVGASA